VDITPEGLREEGGDVSALVPRVGVPKPKLHLNLRDPEALAADVERCVLCLCLVWGVNAARVLGFLMKGW
jgi:hypothetical protein